MGYGQRPGNYGHRGNWRPPTGRSLPQCRYGQRDCPREPGRYRRARYDPCGHLAGGGRGCRPPQWRYGRQRYEQWNQQRGYPPRQYPQLLQLSQAELRGYGPPGGPLPAGPRWPSRTGAATRLLAPAVTGGALLIATVVAAAGGIQHGAPQACPQQYAAWKNGAGAATAIGAQMSALRAAGKAEDSRAIDGALEKIGADARADAARPMPACADPAGFWPQVLSALRAAGDDALVAPGFAGLVTAEAPLKPVSGIEAKLWAELERTAAPRASLRPAGGRPAAGRRPPRIPWRAQPSRSGDGERRPENGAAARTGLIPVR
jgi:hypothetical protein